jgi:hypothetical protein
MRGAGHVAGIRKMRHGDNILAEQNGPLENSRRIWNNSKIVHLSGGGLSRSFV